MATIHETTTIWNGTEWPARREQAGRWDLAAGKAPDYSPTGPHPTFAKHDDGTPVMFDGASFRPIPKDGCRCEHCPRYAPEGPEGID